MTKGKFVLFEGMDGSGKTTLVNCVRDRMTANGLNVRVMRFPGRESVFGKAIRDSFEVPTTFHADAMPWAFVAEAKDMDAQIQKCLDDGVWVIADRHALVSSRVYQGATHGADVVEQVLGAAKLTLPDHLFIVDVPPAVSVTRRAKRGEAANVFFETDEIERLNATRMQYLTVVEHFPAESWAVLNGENSTDVLAQYVIDHVDTKP